MATNVNLLDRAPTPLITALNWTVGTLEDPTGLDRPLWIDVSRYQGQVNWEVMAANGVLGMAARAGISWGYQDPWFPANWQGADNFGLFRTSYHVIWTDQSIIDQADNWYRVHPERDIVPRIIDFEVDRGDSAGHKAEAVWSMSDLVLKRDGIRPLIYSRYLLVNGWLKDWTLDMLNAHHWILAQYTWDRVREHPGPPTLPNGLNRDRVVLHQAADKKSSFPGSCQSYALDFDRWELGTVSEMYQFIDQEWGSGPVSPPPEPQPVLTLQVTNNPYVNVRTGPGTSYMDVGDLLVGTKVDPLDVGGEDVWVKISRDPDRWAAVRTGGKTYMVKV